MTFETARQALRSARRSPVFTATVVSILGLAVGGTGALFVLFNAVVLRPLPVRAPHELVLVTPGRGEARFGFSGQTFSELRRSQTVFEDICAYTRSGVAINIPELPQTLNLEAISDNCDAVLGRQPFMGRMLGEADRGFELGAPGVAVASYEFWTRFLNRDPNAIGRVIETPRLPLTIVGVAGPRAPMDADSGADLIVTMGASAKLSGRPAILVVDAIGRLRQGQSLGSADAALRALWPAVWAAANPATTGPPSPASQAESLRIESFARGLSALRFRYAEAVRALFWMAVLLLVLACLNAGSLLLARTLSREHEVGILTALGATPAHLLGRAASEGLVMALGAAVLALPIAWAGSKVLVATVWTASTPLAMDVTPPAWVLAAIVVSAIGAGLAASLPGTVFVWRFRALASRASSRVSTRRNTRGRRVLIVAQVAVSFVLVFGAGLFTRSLTSLRELDPGFDPAPVRVSRISLRFGQPRNIDHVAYFRPLLDQLKALPQVAGVALSTPFPGTELRHVVGQFPFSRPDLPAGPKAGGQVNWIGPDFFSTLGVAVQQGREFLWTDDAKQPAIAIINRAVSDELFPQGDAVGRTIRIDDMRLDVTIVGVVGDVTPGDYRLTHLPRIYRPLAQEPAVMVVPTLVYRVDGDAGLTDQVRSIVEPMGRHSVDPVQSIEAQSDVFFMRERVLAGIGVAFAILSTLIGAVGLYALMAFTATRRIREAGIRMALGASRGRVMRLLAFDVGRLVLVGIAAGIPLGLMAGRAAGNLLTGIPPSDASSLAVAAGTLVVTGGLACALPALIVVKTGLTTALRAE